MCILIIFTPQKMNFSIKDFFSKCVAKSAITDTITFTDEILNEKLHFFCSVCLLARHS